MSSLDVSLPLPQLLFLLGLCIAFLGLIGAKGTVREIAFDLSPTTNRFVAVGFGAALVLVGTQYPRVFPAVPEAAAMPASSLTPIVAASSTLMPVATPTIVAAQPTAVPSVVVASADTWECTLPGSFNIRERPGKSYFANGTPLGKGEKVRVSGWSRASDNSSDLSWFRVTADGGRTGWMISAAAVQNAHLYLTCNFSTEGPSYPFPQLSV